MGGVEPDQTMDFPPLDLICAIIFIGDSDFIISRTAVDAALAGKKRTRGEAFDVGDPFVFERVYVALLIRSSTK